MASEVYHVLRCGAYDWRVYAALPPGIPSPIISKHTTKRGARAALRKIQAGKAVGA